MSDDDPFAFSVVVACPRCGTRVGRVTARWEDLDGRLRVQRADSRGVCGACGGEWDWPSHDKIEDAVRRARAREAGGQYGGRVASVRAVRH